MQNVHSNPKIISLNSLDKPCLIQANNLMSPIPGRQFNQDVMASSNAASILGMATFRRSPS
jgi:hypothetical protein